MADAWRSVILPWFESTAARAWRDGRTIAVVLPHRRLAVSFRAQLLEQGMSLLGIHFLSPAQLRAHLAGHTDFQLASREHLRLLLAIAAEECGREQGADEPASAARAIARAPDHLLRAIDQLGAAGWSFGESASPEIREIIRRFDRLVHRCEFTPAYAADRAAVPTSARFRDLLIAGFDGAHWAHWPLLLAAAKGAKRATVVLTDPRDEARDLDATWIGSWEQEFGAAVPVDAGDDPQLSLFAPEFARSAGTQADVQFLVGRDSTEQAHAIVEICAKFLADDRGRQIGILFAEPGALPRLVAEALAAAGIAHHDAIAHFSPGPFEENAWTAWLDLQASQRLAPVGRFLAAHPGALAAFGGLTSRQVDKVLRRALDEILIDDLDVLRELCRAREGEREMLVATGLSRLRILPPTATFSEFLRETGEIFYLLGWHERWTEIQRSSAGWSSAVDSKFSRATYLHWLSEITSSFAAVREEIGNHPYSRVQLLLYPHAAEQNWSHLIFCGVNDGAWPPRSASAAFVGDEELAALNARARRLNQRALRRGRQGEGHITVAPGHSLCLGAAEQREIADRQFAALLESADVGVAVTASLLDEISPGRMANPGEFFTRLYFSKHGHALSQATFAELQRETRRALRASKISHDPADSDIQQTRVAFDQRRAITSAGEYEFALREPLARPVTIAATAWESAINAPALVWLKTFLGVVPEENGERFSLATGHWVHHWLGAIGGRDPATQFTPVPAPMELRRIVGTEAQCFRTNVGSLLQTCGRPIPDWWLSGWSNAAYLADCFAAKLANLSDWHELATEWRLEPARIGVGENAELSFSGRADLILARGEIGSPERDLWVIDYKTGRGKKNLRPSRCDSDEELSEKLAKKLQCGDGIQLALYALALRGAGARTVGVSLLSPILSLDRPQLFADEIAAQEGFWRELARMQATGIFGMRGPIRSDFNFTGAYPLATLAVAPELLEAKWALTHPTLAGVDEESEE